MFVGHTPDRQRGDTIVEVLIAIAVTTLVLSGAYVATNRSIQSTRSAQERSIALKLAESQIERVKTLVSTTPAAIFGATAPATFCISNANTIIDAVATPASCGLNSTGAVSSAEPIFHVSITNNANQFNVTETWFDVSGKVNDELHMRYRVYQ